MGSDGKNNINYSDSNLLVNNIQYFLHENYSKVFKMSGVYDEYTHSKLIKYLDMSNSIQPYELVKLISDVETKNGVQPFKSMECHTESDVIVYHLQNPLSVEGFSYNNTIDLNRYDLFKTTVSYLIGVYDDVYDIVYSNGWRIAEYIDTYANESDLTEDLIKDRISVDIVLKKSTPTNLFPHWDVRYMINYFNNDYVNNIEIMSGFFTKSSDYRVAMVQCKPNDTFILAHSYSYSIPFKAGFCTANISDIKDILYTSTNNTALSIQKMSVIIDKRLLPGMPTLITVPDDNEYQTMLIELPILKYTTQSQAEVAGKKSTLSYVDTNLVIGDLNNDGVIDEIDLMLYESQKSYGTQKFILSEEYERYTRLCDAVIRRYSTMFNSYRTINGQYQKIIGQYNNQKIYSNNTSNTLFVSVDMLVKHLRIICCGTDITFTRYQQDNSIYYTISFGTFAKKCYNIMNEFDDLKVSAREKYIQYISGDTSNTTLGKYVRYSKINETYLADANIGNITIDADPNMTINNILVIKTNPNDNITECNQIISGNNNSPSGTLNLPISEFKNNPWMVREELLLATNEMLISQYSREEDINVIQSLIDADEDNIYKGVFGRPYEYNDNLRRYIQSLQMTDGEYFSLGYATPVIYNILYNSFMESENKYNNN